MAIITFPEHFLRISRTTAENPKQPLYFHWASSATLVHFSQGWMKAQRVASLCKHKYEDLHAIAHKNVLRMPNVALAMLKEVRRVAIGWLYEWWQIAKMVQETMRMQNRSWTIAQWMWRLLGCWPEKSTCGVSKDAEWLLKRLHWTRKNRTFQDTPEQPSTFCVVQWRHAFLCNGGLMMMFRIPLHVIFWA